MTAMAATKKGARSGARASPRKSNPHFTISHWVLTQPFRDEAMREHFIDGYRKAGLPE